MKKIMFNDTYGLTEAVLQGRKTMTRRIVRYPNLLQWLREMDVAEYSIRGTILDEFNDYKIGEVVAIAQSYKDVLEQMIKAKGGYGEEENAFFELYKDTPGWNNKMFVKAELMLNFIRITDIKVERLQDISVRDCMREGIEDIHLPQLYQTGNHAYTFDGCTEGQIFGEINGFVSPLAAFAALIDKVSGRGTWENNPWVFVYTFEVIKEGGEK